MAAGAVRRAGPSIFDKVMSLKPRRRNGPPSRPSETGRGRRHDDAGWRYEERRGRRRGEGKEKREGVAERRGTRGRGRGGEGGKNGGKVDDSVYVSCQPQALSLLVSNNTQTLIPISPFPPFFSYLTARGASKGVSAKSLGTKNSGACPPEAEEREGGMGGGKRGWKGG